jgi:hypothetical protein
MEDVLDDLCAAVNTFSITNAQDEFQSDLDTIMKKMNCVNIEDTNENWLVLQTNYTKLKYLLRCIKSCSFGLSGKFSEILGKFIESIDRQTQLYIEEIDFFEVDRDELLIKELLLESLNQNDPVAKMSKILEAYTLLIPLVEKLRGEKYTFDPSFLEDLEPPAPKRQKY